MARVRAQYHKLSMQWHPQLYKPNYRRGCTPVAKQYKATMRKFREVTIAYLVLKDQALREIYDEHGMEHIIKSER
jgi:DnaJ-class molecular chaperone